MGEYDYLSPENTPIVIIHWNDIQKTTSRDYDTEELPHVTDEQIVGYLLKKDDKEIVLAQNYLHDEQRWTDLHAFPNKLPEIQYVSVPAEMLVDGVEDEEDAADER